jgi:hypothetical protein
MRNARIDRILDLIDAVLGADPIELDPALVERDLFASAGPRGTAMARTDLSR